MCVCFWCAAVTVYRADGGRRVPTVDELNRIYADPDVQRTIATINRRNAIGGSTTQLPN